jgi:4-hydroxy-tetrahydrodipicolinate reductase
MKVAVIGAAGRMGVEVCRAIAADSSLELAAAVDPAAAGSPVSERTGIATDLRYAGDLAANVSWCAANGVHAVVGTTGFSDADLDGFRRGFTRSNCLIAPNFAIGAVLMMRFAEIAAPLFESAEIIEFHHENKIDSPSGTAMATASRMAAAKAAAGQSWIADPTTKEMLGGSRGGLGPTGIRVHGVRMRGMVAHQEVILGTTGQTLVIRHDTTDRTSFMPGVVLAVKRIAGHPGVTIGLDAFL